MAMKTIEQVLIERKAQKAAAFERAVENFVRNPDLRRRFLVEKQTLLEQLRAQSALLGDLESDLEERRRRLDEEIEQVQSYLSALQEAQERASAEESV